jgi:hypothetical protein
MNLEKSGSFNSYYCEKSHAFQLRHGRRAFPREVASAKEAAA